MVKQDLPTPPPPTTTSLYSRRNYRVDTVSKAGQRMGFACKQTKWLGVRTLVADAIVKGTSDEQLCQDF